MMTVSFKPPIFFRVDIMLTAAEGLMSQCSYLVLYMVLTMLDGAQLTSAQILEASAIFRNSQQYCRVDRRNPDFPCLRYKWYKSPIPLLGEATASLNIENVLAVRTAISHLLRQKKTVIMIAQTLSIIHNADKILVLSQGKITEEGTHEELIQKNGKYAAV